MIAVPAHPDFNHWRSTARSLLAQEIPPADVQFIEPDAESSFLPAFSTNALESPAPVAATTKVPEAFIDLARLAVCFRDPSRWLLLYRLLWRLSHGEHQLMQLIVDDDVYELTRMVKAVRRDAHKMKAFVRFRLVPADGIEQSPEHYIAWHRPDHFIVRHVAPFFADRFAPMHWTILTPDASVSWDTQSLTFGPGAPASAAPSHDDLEEFWKTYYASIFNPARVNIVAMQKEMPKKHWATLPEAALIPELLQQAPRRVESMMKTERPRGPVSKNAQRPNATSAADFLPARRTLPQLRKAAATCRGCDLYCHATQTVFGEGPASASLVFIGEQPGDQEDLAGHPFVGPSGQLLNDALDTAGIDRDTVYITNAVKHFKFEQRGPRRIHAKPSARQMQACRPWLEAELAAIQPRLIVCLGATAAQSLLGPQFRLTKHRGEFLPSNYAPALLATNHPSAILRVPDPKMREESHAQFIADLKLVAQRLKKSA
jgi:probable DNA metabolism protein